MKTLSPAELRQYLSDHPETQLVDVREYAEYAGQHLAGSTLIPLGSLQTRMHELNRDHPVILVCRSGMRSGQARQQLSAAGFKEVTHLEGGLMAWRQAGLPVEKKAKAPWAIDRQVRFIASLLILVGLAGSRYWPPAILLAWMMPIGMILTCITDSCLMGMCLAKMPWNRQPACCSS